MTRLVHRPTGERGAAALLVAALTIVLIGVLAFVTDFGMAYANQRRLQNGVDAAVLAVGQKVAASTGDRQSCQQVLASLDEDELRAFAVGFVEQNAPAEGVDLEAGTSGFSVTCEALGETGAEQIVVSAAGAQSSPTFFGGVLGADGIGLREGARAVVGVGIPLGLRPFGICADDAEELMSSTGAYTVVYARGQGNGRAGDSVGSCGETGPAGHWGLLDFGMGIEHGLGSGKDCTGAVTDGIKCWVKEGFNGALRPPTAVPGKTGVLTQVKDEMSAILGAELPIPVYSSVVAGNPQDHYVVTGFVYVKICAYDFGGNSEATAGCVEEPQWSQREEVGAQDGQAARAAWPAANVPLFSPRIEAVAGVEAKSLARADSWWDQVDQSTIRDLIRDLLCRIFGVCAPSPPSPPSDPGPPGDSSGGQSQTASYLQLRFVRHITAGTLDLDCGLGSDCDFGLRVVKLAE
ncbi:MAG: pilus assembly protein TadG-related protein [Actinomycetota bacterium]